MARRWLETADPRFLLSLQQDRVATRCREERAQIVARYRAAASLIVARRQLREAEMEAFRQRRARMLRGRAPTSRQSVVDARADTT